MKAKHDLPEGWKSIIGKEREVKNLVKKDISWVYEMLGWKKHVSIQKDL